MTCVRRNLNNRACCNSWQKGIRTINNQYPDDNREFEIAAGNGISVVPITAGILITNTSAASSFVEGRNIDIVPSGTDLQISVEDQPDFDGLTVNGTSTFNGDIIQNGAAYETHAEKLYTTNDYIVTRDGAISALSAGDYSGFQVKKYDGTNDGRLVIDSAGVARVGDVGDEQPLLTRDESADLTDGESLVWDSANSKAVTEAIPSAINTALSGKQNTLTITRLYNNGGVTVDRCGPIVQISLYGYNPGSSGEHIITTGLPSPVAQAAGTLDANSSQYNGRAWIETSGRLKSYLLTSASSYGGFVYITNDP